jgi:hypothetical protein
MTTTKPHGPETDAIRSGWCPVRANRTHCKCWWEGARCCGCGHGPELEPEESEAK